MQKSNQSPSAILMVRPHHFFPNAETAGDNSFQSEESPLKAPRIKKAAMDEFDKVVTMLRIEGVEVIVVEDRDDVDTPDSVFPNNWISTHHEGTIVTYPMLVPSRRRERREDIIEHFEEAYEVSKVLEMNNLETNGHILEGTGAIVFDHDSKLAYMARSERATEPALDFLCKELGYEKLVFDSIGPDGNPIYHTNVIMGIGHEVAFVGFDCIVGDEAKDKVRDSLEKSGKEIIDLTMDQIGQFAGNVFELTTPTGPIFALSQTAYDALTAKQIKQANKKARLVPMAVPTIEKSGGSIRCMMAAIHLLRKN
jgi:hypothetical protein